MPQEIGGRNNERDENMAWILDLIVVAVFLLSIWLGWRRGFFKSIMQLVGCLAAALIAWGLSAPAAEGIYRQFLSAPVQKTLASQFEKAGNNAAETALGTALSELPGPVKSALGMFSLDSASQIREKMGGTLAGTANELAKKIEETIIHPAAVSLLRIAVFFVLFLVLMVLVEIAARLLNQLFKKLPVVRDINGVLGGVVGALQGVVLVFVVVTVMTLMAASSKGEGKVTRAVMSETVLVHTIESVNPLSQTLETLSGAKSV